MIKEKLKLTIKDKKLLEKWKIFAEKLDHKKNIKKIAIISKYIKLKDSHLSLTHGIKHAALHLDIYPEIIFVDACKIEENDKQSWDTVMESDGIIIPGGFGPRGVEGIIQVIKYARENQKVILGICYGMQLQIIEILRNCAGINKATSEEFKLKDTVDIAGVVKMDDLNQKEMGGTMRLGSKDTYLKKWTKAFEVYAGCEIIKERHRHRYEINPDYIEVLEKYNLKFSGKDKTGMRMEILELNNHPFFMGCQFHPECNTYPEKPHPLFIEFLKSCF